MAKQSRGRRRSAEEAREEILDAAERFLHDQPFRVLTVGRLMERTQIGRSAFYLYFQDRYDLIRALVVRLEARVREVVRPWLEGLGEDPAIDLTASLEALVALFVEHGSVFRAIADASTQDREVERYWRWGIVQTFEEAVAMRIRAEQKAGRVDREIDPEETAQALVQLNSAYLPDRLGRLPPADPERIRRTLTSIWHRALYGAPEVGPPRG